MKIGYVCNEYPPQPHGGIGTFVHTMAQAMTVAGHQVTVVGLGAENAERNDGAVRVITLSRPGRLLMMPSLSARLRLYDWLVREASAGRLDIIELPEYEGLLPVPFRQCPTVLRLHLSSTSIARQQGRSYSRFRAWCERGTLRRHPNWIAVSRYALDLTTGTFHLTPARTEIIYSPVTIATERPASMPVLPTQFVLHAGTISGRKGAYALAEAALEFLPPNPDLELVYAGTIQREDGIAADAKIREILGPVLARRVHFPGRMNRPQLAECMRKAVLCVAASNLETFGLVTAEAMLAGAPVVATDAGPTGEFLKNGENGLLVERNNPRALAAAIQRLLADADLRRRFSLLGKASIESRFTVTQCVKASEHFYHSLICSDRARALSR